NVISITSVDAGVIVSALPADLGLLPVPTATPSPTLRPVVRPTAAPPPPPTDVCAGLRLTAPLDGLPNGGATFYWDPVADPTATYSITIFDEGGNVLTGFNAGTATNVSGNVSQGAIGGAFQL